MSGRRIAALTAVAASLAILVAVLVDGGSPAGLDPMPSTENGDPRGLLAAYRYLEARGVDVARIEDDFTLHAKDAGILVLPAPARRTLDEASVEAALEVARGGGVLVVLLPEDAGRGQPHLVEALGIEVARDRPGPEGPPSLTGRERHVTLRPVVQGDPLLAGAAEIHVAPARALSVEDAEAVARVGGDGFPGILRRPEGAGVVYVLADPSAIENHRLDLADNLHLLEGLAALAAGRPVRFDESHHRALRPEEIGPRTTLAGWRAVGLQIALSTAVLMLAVGRRFGPIRPLVVDRRRSTLEYVANLAALYRRAGAEAELCREVERDLRARLYERWSVPAALEENEAARRLSARTGVPEEALLETLAAIRRAPADLAAAIRAVADLDARLDGRPVA